MVTNERTGASLCEAAWSGETADRDNCEQAQVLVSLAAFEFLHSKSSSSKMTLRLVHLKQIVTKDKERL